MPDTISPSASARAKCRGCGLAIAKGELRFGESAPNPYGEGETLGWFHLECAAGMRPEKLTATLDAPALPPDLRERLVPLAASGMAHPRLARILRAERAASGRAHCRHCRETIDKGAFRIALQLFEDGRMTPIGFVHVECSSGYFGTRDTVIERLRRWTPELSPEDLASIEAELAKESRPAAPGVAKAEPPSASAEEPAKAHGGS